MKKIISFLIPLVLLVNVTFAKNFFSSRIFELRVDVPVEFSNNALSLNDFLKQDCVIDLTEIAGRLPSSGFTTVTSLAPNVAFNLNIGFFSLGTKIGVDGYLKLNISKDLFDLIGNGYIMGNTVNVKVDPIVDLFAFGEVPVGLKISKLSIKAIPSVFMPIAVADDCKVSLSGYNDASGKLIAKLDNDINIYTSKLYDVYADEISFSEINLFDYLGFDLGAEVGFDFSKDLRFSIDAKIPIVPGKLDKKLNIKNTFEMNTTVMDLGDMKPTNESKKEIVDLQEKFYINRPLKAHLFIDYKPIGLLKLKAGGGVGIRHPFTDSYYVYPEYLVGATLTLFDIIQAGLSTEYTNQMFIHKLETVVSLRIVEIDAGISLESTSFVESFKLTGLGAHVGVAVGF